MSDPDYRVQARAVRAAARQRIRELSLRRGTQVPRWQAAASAPAADASTTAPPLAETTAVPPPVEAEPGPRAHAHETAAPPPPARSFSPEAASPDAASRPEQPAAARPAAPAPNPAPLATDADDEADADAEADGHDLSVMTVSLAAAALANRTAGRAADAEAVSLADSDLARLPGVGPGLVWLLGQAGVSDCTTLIDSDPAALADRLGVVGQLIEISGLQALAARHAGEKPTRTASGAHPR